MKTKVLGSIILGVCILAFVFFAYNNQKNSEKDSTNSSPLSGTYTLQTNENEENCKLTISLKQDGDVLKYGLSVLKQDSNDKFLKDTRDIQGNALYDSKNQIVSLKWISFWTNEMKQNKLDIVYNDKNQTLEFQNEGNNMNSFTVIPECSEKFVVLKK